MLLSIVMQRPTGRKRLMPLDPSVILSSYPVSTDMPITNCAVCLDSIRFGRQVSVCQECGASAHVKCSVRLPSTCGLPLGLAEHIGDEVNNRQEETFPINRGWVKIPRTDKANCWERKFLKVFSNFYWKRSKFLKLFSHFRFREMNFVFTTTSQVRTTFDRSTVSICGQQMAAL